MTLPEIHTLYRDRFAGEPLIKITKEERSVKAISGKHRIEIGQLMVHSSGRRVVVCVALDNLLKGRSKI